MITILGPTASGKTRLAAQLAADIGAEIISADSRQVYRRMDIGTGKDRGDYTVEGREMAAHLLDIAEPGEHYNLYRYQQDFARAYSDITARGLTPILCGGSGLYIEAVVRGYQLPAAEENKALRASLEGKSLEELSAMLAAMKRQKGKELHNTTDTDTAKRAIRAIEIELAGAAGGGDKGLQPLDTLIIGIDISREERRRRISQRLKERLEAGMVGEIRSLLGEGLEPEQLMYYGLEYKYVTQYVVGQTTFDEMFSLLETAIHQFAKRQMTWFRGMERRGLTIHWISAGLTESEKINQIKLLWAQTSRDGAYSTAPKTASALARGSGNE